MDDEYLTLEDEQLALNNHGSRSTAPEKRLDSPICDGLITRLVQYATEFEETFQPQRTLLNRRNLAIDWASYIQPHKTRTFSNMIHYIKQFGDIVSNIGYIPKVIIAEEYPNFYNLYDSKSHYLHSDLQLANDIYQNAIDSYIKWISDVCKPSEIIKVRDNLKLNLQISPETLKYGKTSHMWSRLVDSYRKNNSNGRLPKLVTTETVEMWIASDFACIREKSKKSNEEPDWKLIVYEQLQMIQDATTARFNTLLCLDLGLHNGSPALKSQVLRMLDWHDRCLNTYGNKGFELVKAPEALYKTWINELVAGDILDYSSFERTVDKIKKKESRWDTLTPRVNEIVRLIKECSNIRDAAELFGLIKLSGHPTVYAEMSAKSVRDEACPPDPSRPSSIFRVVRAVKHIILAAYIEKHQEWPRFTRAPPYGSELRRHFLNRSTSLPYNSYDQASLDQVEFGRFIDFDYSDDFLKFLDDKAISAGADELWKFWWPASRDEPRRVLIKALETKTISMRDLVERLRKGETTRNEEIVELTQKERELKREARCFCKLVFAMRCYFTLTEYNLKEYLMKNYVPQQTMTMSEAQTKKRLYAMAYRTVLDNQAVVEIDFSRWNLRWRSACVNMVARVCEDIYGLPGVFSQAHHFFSRATVVLTDKHTLPRGAQPNTSAHSWPNSELKWTSHLGGFEGIQQGLWTLCTIGMVYYCLSDKPVSFLMAGQGDNQVMVLRFTDNHVKGWLVKILAALEIRCRSLNQIVKPDECIDSRYVLTYSKEIFVKGVHIQYSLKFLSRTMAIHDSDIPSLSSEVSAVCSSAIASACTLPVPLMGFFWQTFKLIRLFREHIRFSVSHTTQHQLVRFFQDKNLLKFSLVLPGSLGGLPLMSWGRFFVRGEVDELSWDVAALLHLDQSILKKDLHLLLSGKYKPQRLDLESLINDPSSIPVTKPIDQTRLIKQHLESHLPRMTKNTWLREIMVAAVGQLGDSLIKDLITTRPFYPSILADLHSCSLSGLRSDIYGRFNMTRTISSALGGMAFAREIAESSGALLSWVRYRYTNATNSKKSVALTHEDTFDTALKLRSQWGLESDGMLGTNHCPLASRLTPNVSTEPCISAISRTPLRMLRDSVGIYSPNFGTNTRQKVSQHGYKITTSDDTTSTIRDLVLTATQVNAGPTLRKIINELIQARCPFTLDDLLTVFPTAYSGAAAHRHKAMQTKHFAYMGSCTISSHLSLSSDGAGILAGGIDDYPFPFQVFYLLLQNLAQVLSVTLPESNRNFYAGLSIPLMTPLPETNMEATTYTPRTWPVSDTNALAYTNHFRVSLLTSRPPSHYIPNRSRRGRSSIILASYLLSKSRIKLDSVLRMSGSILSPTESLDIAELNGISFFELVHGCSLFTIIEVCYTLFVSNNSPDPDRLDYLTQKVASSIAGTIARGILAPAYNFKSEARDAGLSLTPGVLSAPRVATTLASIITAHARPLFRSNYIALLPDPWIIFADTMCSGLTICRKVAAFVLMQISTRTSDTHLAVKHRTIIMDSFRPLTHVITAQEAIISGILATRNILEHKSQSPNPNLSNKATAYLSSWPNMVWDQRDADEAKRDLRIQRPTNGKQSKLPTITEYPRPLRIKRCAAEVGFCPYNYPDKPRNEHTRVTDLLCRSYGVYATATTVWISILSRHRDDFDGCHVLSVGVGRGAVAHAAQLLNSRLVTAIDLRETFPAIAQREIQYVPSEVYDPQRFRWDDSCFDFTGGNWKVINGDRHFDDIDTLIIDIESATFSLDELPKYLNKVCYIRCFLTLDQLKWIISILNNPTVYCLNTIPDLELTNAYLIRYITDTDYSDSSSPNSVEIISMPPFRCIFPSTLETTIMRINNNLLSLYPYRVTIWDRVSLEQTINHLTGYRRQLVTTDRTQGLQRLIDTLTFYYRVYNEPIDAVVTRLRQIKDPYLTRTMCLLLSQRYTIDDVSI